MLVSIAPRICSGDNEKSVTETCDSNGSTVTVDSTRKVVASWLAVADDPIRRPASDLSTTVVTFSTFVSSDPGEQSERSPFVPWKVHVSDKSPVEIELTIACADDERSVPETCASYGKDAVSIRMVAATPSWLAVADDSIRRPASDLFTTVLVLALFIWTYSSKLIFLRFSKEWFMAWLESSRGGLGGV